MINNFELYVDNRGLVTTSKNYEEVYNDLCYYYEYILDEGESAVIICNYGDGLSDIIAEAYKGEGINILVSLE